MPASPSSSPQEATQQHYQTISGRTLKKGEKIDSNGKRIHFIDCVFEE